MKMKKIIKIQSEVKLWTSVNLDSYQNTELTIEVINKSLIHSFSTEALKYFIALVGLKMTKKVTHLLTVCDFSVYLDSKPYLFGSR